MENDKAKRILSIDTVKTDDGREEVVCEFLPNKQKLTAVMASVLMNDSALTEAIYEAVVLTAERTGRKGRLIGRLSGLQKKQ